MIEQTIFAVVLIVVWAGVMTRLCAMQARHMTSTTAWYVGLADARAGKPAEPSPRYSPDERASYEAGYNYYEESTE